MGDADTFWDKEFDVAHSGQKNLKDGRAQYNKTLVFEWSFLRRSPVLRVLPTLLFSSDIKEVPKMAISVPVDGEGFLVNRDDWNEEVAVEMAKADEFEMNDQVMSYIMDARAMYDADGVVPPIRKFAKKQGVSTKDLYGVFQKGPMKLICKWGGLPKPTGCV